MARFMLKVDNFTTKVLCVKCQVAMAVKMHELQVELTASANLLCDPLYDALEVICYPA